jgi:hypothetical protein
VSGGEDEDGDSESSLPYSLKVQEIVDVAGAIGLPLVPGCEPGSPAVAAMAERFPDTPVPDLIRFLIARKGQVLSSLKCVLVE